MQLRTAPRVVIPTFIIALLAIAFASVLSSRADAGDETTYYLLTDHLGSVDVVLDDAGTVVERRDYLPYGSERLSDTAPDTPETDHKFTGKELDDETGLHYYGARYYDAEIGRFVSVDPWEGDLEDPQSLNKYSYVQNNPIRFVDPTGMWGVAVGFGGNSHQFITNLALDNSNYCVAENQRNTLVFSASVWADVLVYAFDNKNSYNHATSYGNGMSGLDIKNAMKSDAQKWYTSGYLDDFGRLLHMTEDAYAPAHTERDEDGNITAFLDYSKQKLSQHLEYDNYKDENGEIRPEVYQAATAASKMIDYYYSGASWTEVEDFYDSEVLKGVNEETEVGKPGKKFEE